MDLHTLAALGARIKAARERAGMRQIDLAVACGWTSGSRLGNYEQGTREPSLSDLAKIAAITGVRMAWLVVDAPPMLEFAVGEEGATYDAKGRILTPLTEQEFASIERMRSMSPDSRDLISAVVNAIDAPKKSA